MNTTEDRYSKLLEAIEAERKHEESFFTTLHQNKSIQQKVEAGFVWYPIMIVKKNYTVGEYIEVELQQTKAFLTHHKFSEGVAASLFNMGSEKTALKVIVSSIRKDKMKVLIAADLLEVLDIFDKGLSGIELVYDEKPYKVMEAAIRQLQASKDSVHLQIKKAIEGSPLRQYVSELFHIVPFETYKNTNDSQKKAIETCLSAPIISIIHGPPGTGKTTTLVALAQQLLTVEKRILVCASSNNAVDLFAEKLSLIGLNVLRVGNITRIHDHLMHLTLEEKVRKHPDWNHIKKVKIQAQEVDKKSSQYIRNFGPEQQHEKRALRKEAKELRKWALELEDRLIQQIISESQVIATTLVGASHRLLQGLTFTTVIIDETSQALEAECWNAILKAKKVVLAGDHKQLPPTVKSQEAKQLGLEITMLDVLAPTLAQTSLLTEQYRMNDQILGFSNHRFYEGKLFGAPHVKSWRIRNDAHPILFLDTAGCGFEEEHHAHHKSYTNSGEYFIIREHLLAHAENLLGETIGIICPYAEQVRYIRSQIETEANLKVFDLEVNSIDGFQGQEKSVIYLSLVRSNSLGEIGFLKDERRINVAMTRAKKKLIIVGDSATVGQHALYADLIDYFTLQGFYDSAWTYMSY